MIKAMKKAAGKYLAFFWRLFFRIEPIDRKKIENFMHGKKYLIATIGNSGFLEYTLNWVGHLNALGIKNYVVFTQDRNFHRVLSKKGINSYIVRTNASLPSGIMPFGYFGYNTLLYFRALLVYDLLKKGVDVLFSDTDTIWLKEPIQYIDLAKPYDIYIQSNEETLEVMESFFPHPSCNAGFYFAKSNKKTISFFRTILKEMLLNPLLNDEDCFNKILKRESDSIVFSISGLCAKKGSRKLHLKLLDPLDFPNGFVYFRNMGIFKRLDAQPAVIHANWLNVNKKIKLLKEQGLWKVK